MVISARGLSTYISVLLSGALRINCLTLKCLTPKDESNAAWLAISNYARSSFFFSGEFEGEHDIILASYACGYIRGAEVAQNIGRVQYTLLLKNGTLAL